MHDIGAGGNSDAVPLYGQTVENLSNSRYAGLEGSFKNDPPVGLGGIVNLSLIRAYAYDISPCFYCNRSDDFVLDSDAKSRNHQLGELRGKQYAPAPTGSTTRSATPCRTRRDTARFTTACRGVVWRYSARRSTAATTPSSVPRSTSSTRRFARRSTTSNVRANVGLQSVQYVRCRLRNRVCRNSGSGSRQRQLRVDQREVALADDIPVRISP